MKITIVAVGKIKEKYFKDAVLEYTKRLSRYCTLNIIEAEDEKTPDKPSETEILMIQEKEADRIDKYIKEQAYTIVLAIQGQKMDSLKFASQIEQLAVQGKSHIQFIIGGSLGLHPRLLNKADMKLSFSDMTFPHQLMRVVLLEQIYRGYRIINGEPYHK